METIQSVGRCVNSNEDIGFWAFAGPLVAHHLILMIGTNFLLYQVRGITDRYQEQKYVALASMLIMELVLVGVPVMVAVNDSPTATFVVLTGIIAFGNTGMSCNQSLKSFAPYAVCFLPSPVKLIMISLRFPFLVLHNLQERCALSLFQRFCSR